jgi:hypothetical protein
LRDYHIDFATAAEVVTTPRSIAELSVILQAGSFNISRAQARPQLLED